MPDPNPEADPGPAADAGSPPDARPAVNARSAAEVGPDPEPESGPRDGPALLAATPDADVVFERLRTLALLAGVLGLLVALIAAELLVRI